MMTIDDDDEEEEPPVNLTQNYLNTSENMKYTDIPKNFLL
jgi:hypothetical protein